MTSLKNHRMKRDVEETEDDDEITGKGVEPFDIDIIDGEVRRRPRQSRPLSIGQSSWRYNDPFDQRFLSTTAPEYQSSYKIFNPHLTTPSVHSSQKFKSSPAVPPYQQSSLGNIRNDFKPQKQIFGPLGSPVTELSLNKPYTVHASFDLDDAQSQQNFPGPNSFAPSAQFYPLNIDERRAHKPAAPDTDVDNIPENFSYYHIGNGPNRLGKHPLAPQFPNKLLPQRPVYFENKPIILRAVTPKNHIIQFSTIGGFFNNNPTPSSNEFVQKHKLEREKESYITHKPIIYKDTKLNYETEADRGKYYLKQNFDSPPQQFTPIISTPKPYSVQINPFADSVLFNNRQQLPIREYTNDHINAKSPNTNKFAPNQPSYVPQKSISNLNSTVKKVTKTKEYADNQNLNVPKFSGPNNLHNYYDVHNVSI